MKRALLPRKRGPGRPLSFDRETALHQAMLVFWRHGYEGTSVNDLVTAMGITPPSLYTAFGDKRQLFSEAVQRYVSGPITSASLIEQAPNAREAAKELLSAAAVRFTGEDTPAGCLLATSAISCSESAADVQKELSRIRLNVEKCLRTRIERDNKRKPASQKVDAGSMAGYVMALIQGMSTLARDGASRKKLMGVIELAMKAWPL